MMRGSRKAGPARRWASPCARARRWGFTTHEEGQGLGLHASALAARTLGGRLTVESEGLGKGASATLELPLA